MEEQGERLRLLEAVLFAAVEPLDEATLAAHLPAETELEPLLAELVETYGKRGINLVRVGGKWVFRTAPDLAPRLQIERQATRRLSRAALETLAIIAYHQPVTRPEMENIRGVAMSRGTLDMLLEVGWIKPGRRRDVPGRPTTWVTTDEFLSHFGIDSLKDLPGVKELKAAGLLDKRPAIAVYGSRAHDDELPDDEIAASDDEPEDRLLAEEG